MRAPWLLIGVGCAQFGLVALLLVMFSPPVAFGLAAAIPAVAAILLWPPLGAYVVAATLIGNWPWNLSRHVGMVATGSALLWVLRTRRPLFPRSPLLWLMGLYTLLVLASTINPPTRELIWPAALVHVSFLALTWLFVSVVDDRRRVRVVVSLMVGSGVVTAAVGFVQARAHFVWPASTTAYALTQEINRGQSGLDLQGWQGRFRIDSITGTPDFLPLYLQSLMPFVFFWLVRQESRRRRLLGMAVLLMFGVAHLLSYTRGPILTTAIVAFLMGWMVSRRRVLAFTPGAAVLAFAGLMAWAPMRERLLAAATSGVEELESTAWRVGTIPIGIEMMLRRPLLGVGIGQQQLNWPESAAHLVPMVPGAVAPLHNSYLMAGAELGVGGLLVLVALIGVAWRQLAATARRFEALGETELASYARACLVAFIGVAVAMLGYPMLGSFRYLWLLLALAAALVRTAERMALTPEVEGPRDRVSPHAARA